MNLKVVKNYKWRHYVEWLKFGGEPYYNLVLSRIRIYINKKEKELGVYHENVFFFLFFPLTQKRGKKNVWKSLPILCYL